MPAQSAPSSSPHTQAFSDIKEKEHGMETEGEIRCSKEDCRFSCYFAWQLRNHLAQEHGMKMNTEWKEFNSETVSVVLS